MASKSKQGYTVVFSDPHLFGEDDARYENKDQLLSYFYRREILTDIINPSRSFLVISAPKGSGKTALFRMADELIKGKGTQNSLLRFDSEIAPECSSTQLATWIRNWKKRILDEIAVAIARDIGFAWNSDQIALVEEAQRGGFIAKNFISYILGRANVKGNPIEIKDSENRNPAAITERYLTNSDALTWIWIDEVDEYFSGSGEDISKVASMLLASRELSNQIPTLRVRVSIKPNVLAVLESKIDAISNLREHISPLEWSHEDIRAVLALRVENHLKRNNDLGDEFPQLLDKIEREEWLLRHIFDDSGFDLGSGKREPYYVLSTLAAKRPRWVIELCKQTVKKRGVERNSVISFSDVEKALYSYGQNRIKDFSSEFRCLCSDIEMLISRFTGSRPVYVRLHNLLEFIGKIIDDQFEPIIEGHKGKVTALDVAHLLFRIDFIQARVQLDSGQVAHVFFHERPDILKTTILTENDRLEWVIHPGLRQALLLTQPRIANAEYNKVSVRDKQSPKRRRKSR